MYCKNCGKKIAEDSKFCKNCGTPVGEIHNSLPEVKGPVPQETTAEKTTEREVSVQQVQKRGHPVAAFIFIFLLPLLALGTWYYYATNSTDSVNTSIATSTPAILGQVPANNTITTPSPVTNTSNNLSPSTIAQIEPSVVEVNCYSSDGSVMVSGSGLSTLQKVGYEIWTNYHVYTEAITGGQAPTCYAVYPKPPNFYFNDSYGDYNLTLLSWHYNPATYEDAAQFALGTPLPSSVPPTHIPVLNDYAKYLGLSTGAQCSSTGINPQVGDSVTIFGYPNSGNLLGISETVTTGIISGILPGPIYKTNAAIDHGNSGGVAILNKNGCALGIPTFGSSGLTAGIGYIQSYNLVERAVN